ncbi:unnamed protein product [Urochloa humidicola]
MPHEDLECKHDSDVDLSFSSDSAASYIFPTGGTSRRMLKYSEINFWPCTTMVAWRWDKAFPPDLAVCPWRQRHPRINRTKDRMPATLTSIPAWFPSIPWQQG